jgi:hypothetical protein
MPTGRKLSIDRSTARYRTLSAVAANVAAAAALAAHQDEESARHTARYSSDPPLPPDGLRNFTPRIPLTRDDHDTTDVDTTDNVPAMIDSFYSEGGRDTGRKRVAWSIERHGMRAGSMGRLSTIPPSLVSSTSVEAGSYRRGRSLGRSTGDLLRDTEEILPSESMSLSLTAANRRNSRAGKKGATMVFLGAWALFGVGTLMGNKRALPGRSRLSVGRVLSPLNVRESLGHDVLIAAPMLPSTAEPSDVPRGFREIPLTFEDQDPPPIEPVPPPHDSQPSTERILGRIFAWLCTILYLTSRLPQIWKNVSFTFNALAISC